VHLLAPLHEAATFAATSAERAFLHALGAGCQAPVAGLAVSKEGSTLELTGRVLSTDGATLIEHAAQGHIDNPTELGEVVAQACLMNGADKML
jgi:hydroxymethylbilane synthase